MFCGKFYAELSIAKDRNVLALYLTTVTDGRVTWADAMGMSAEELIDAYKFAGAHARASESTEPVTLEKIKKGMQK